MDHSKCKRLSASKRAFLVDHLGEARTKAIEDRACSWGKELLESGVGYKDINEISGSLANVYSALGGATSFAAADQFAAGEELDENVSTQKRTFDTIMRNILDQDAPLSKKLAQVKKAVADFADRVEDPPIGAKEIGDSVARTLKAYLSGKKTFPEASVRPNESDIPLMKLARQLGVTGKQVASKMLHNNDGTKTRRGVSSVHMYRMAVGSRAGQLRMLEAIGQAARGHKTAHLFPLFARIAVPHLFIPTAGGNKESDPGAAGYGAMLLNAIERGNVPQG
ncbi:hypothetical protein LCGC14_2400680 [marine sediment metagenome]|uniref:Uncharacterized protein n=1 Tax=marine sediment metagenome TaxID=412755 RepID=A0A0F9BVI6_9ZZZZ